MRPRITDVRLLQLRTTEQIGTLEPAWDLGGRMVITTGGGFVTEIHTDDGIVGIGPGFASNLLPVVRRILIGADPFDVEQHAAGAVDGGILAEAPAPEKPGAGKGGVGKGG